MNMPLLASILSFGALAFFVQGCTHTAIHGVKERSMHEAEQPQAEVWFKGSVEDAFLQAQKQKKLVFLYWGAIWCPPCNELKVQVFTKPRFSELMANFIPVYLDGDSEAAQIWGDKFQASGYPTVLVMDEAKKELFRLSTVVTMEEFDSTIQSLLATSGNFERAAQAVTEGRANRRDMQLLAYSPWDQLQDSSWPVARRINVLEQAFASSEAYQEKSLFASAWVSQLLEAKEKVSEKQLEKIWATIFHDSDSIWASREFIKYKAGAVAEWLGWKANEPRYVFLKSQWTKAAAQLEMHPEASVSTRLWSINPELEFYRYENPVEKPTQALRSKVEVAVRHADEEAKTVYDRHSVVSDAAYLLRQVESYELARNLLENELKTTSTPWYYQSSLAALENNLNRPDAAKKWSAAARKSVQGRASKVQWITSDLLLNAKDPKNSSYVAEIAREFYQQALELKDGFVGRNGMRAKKVQEALGAFRKEAKFQKTFAEFAPLCERQIGDSKKNCKEHFAALE